MKSSKQSRKHCREQDDESIEQREARLAKRREQDRAHRAAVHPHQRDALRVKQQRRSALETSEHRQACLERQRITDYERRTNKSEEHRQALLERQRIIDHERIGTKVKSIGKHV